MIQTNTVYDLQEIPSSWMFETYLELNEKLVGQDLMLKSLSNPNDKVPSFHIYPHKTTFKYKFKDFSTGDGGDGIDLVKLMYKLNGKSLSNGEAILKVISDYNTYLTTNDEVLRENKIKEKYKVHAYKIRKWRVLDGKFWMGFHIDSKTLDFFNVKPLEEYTMAKTEDGLHHEFTVSSEFTYGYFKFDGTLYKIYQPYIKERKYIKVESNYIQGSEQLNYKHPYLIIGSGIKDLAVLKRLNLKVELVAPDSENTPIHRDIINVWKSKYKAICTIFDFDAAGVIAMENYKTLYDIPGIQLDIEQDIAKVSKKIGLLELTKVLHPLLLKILK